MTTPENDFTMNQSSGNTALHEAAWNGYSHSIESHAKQKANLNIKNRNGNTPLHLACQQGHNQSSRNLLIYGAKPDIKNNYGDTPLHTAARYGHAGVVRILISAFCNVNEVNKNGDTALHISSAMGRRKLTRILLETGCNPAIKNKQGETAMDIALRKSFKEVQEIIAAIPVKDPPQTKRPKHKSGSIPSQGSRQSREKRHKTKSTSKDHHHNGKIPYHSPYGCPLLPDSKDFPAPKINSLPTEPLRKGEQYYIDLAGNIRKGPVGKVYNCYCVPLIEKVEKKLEKEKKELKEEIENCRTNLNDKISSLERKATIQMVNLNEQVQSHLTTERQECTERTQRSSLKQKLDFERSQLQQAEQLKDQMKYWLESRLSQPTAPTRKYQPNPGRHKSANYCEGLTIQRIHRAGTSLPSAVATVDSASSTKQENVVTDPYDRPKSCLGYSYNNHYDHQNVQNSNNQESTSTLGSRCYRDNDHNYNHHHHHHYVNSNSINNHIGPVRSKSETHLAIVQGDTIGGSVGGNRDNYRLLSGCGYTRRVNNGVCISTTQAEVYYDGANSCSEDSEEDDDEEDDSHHHRHHQTDHHHQHQHRPEEGQIIESKRTDGGGNNGQQEIVNKATQSVAASVGVGQFNSVSSAVNENPEHQNVIYDLPNGQQNGLPMRRMTIEAEINHSEIVSPVGGLNNNLEEKVGVDVGVKCKPIQPLPVSVSTSSHCPPEDDIVVDHSGDLMKSLRCNVVLPRGDTEYRNSPFSDSGFRSKYSPSPREGPLTDLVPIYPPEPPNSNNHINNRFPKDAYTTSNNITILSNHSTHASTIGHHPRPLPSPSMRPRPVPELRPPARRDPIPTRLNVATPASSLV